MNTLINENLFNDYFDKMERRQASQRGTALVIATPDTSLASESVQLGAELGVPPEAVQGAPEVFRTQAEQLRATTTLRDAPLIGEWLTDPINGSLAKDDLENLTWFERHLIGATQTGLAAIPLIGKPLGGSVARGELRVVAAPRYSNAQRYAQRVADIGQTQAQILDEIMPPEQRASLTRGGMYRLVADAENQAEIRFMNAQALSMDETVARGADRLAQAQSIIQMSQAIPMSEAATAFRDGTLANAENTLMGTLGAFVADPLRGAAFIAETAAETLPVLAAATAATYTTGSPTAGVAVMGSGSFLMENSTSAMEFLNERGVDMSTPEAAAAVIQNSELMQEAQEFGVTRGLIIAAFDAISGGVAGKVLMKNPAGDVVVQGIAQAALGSGGEATAQLVTTGELDWREVVIEGLAEFATAPIEVLGVGGRSLMQELARFGKSGGTAATIDQIDEVANTSQLRVRSADRFLSALEAAGVDEQSMYVSAEGLQEYFQAKDVELDAETLRAWGIEPMDYQEKLASGGDVTVPVSNYAARISGAEDAEWFRENAVFSPDEMSVAEAADFNGRVRDIMADAFDEAEAQRVAEQSLRADDVQIYDQVFSDLRAAGRSPDVAKNEASVWSAFWRTMGERYGASAIDLALSMGVRIQGPQTPEVARQRDQVDVMINTLRSQGDKALRPSGMGILDFVRDQGGVRDRGGDVQSMDAPRGVIAETRSQISERESQPNLDGRTGMDGRGVDLDQLGRAMIEAGYFPEYMGGANVNDDGTVVDEAAIALQAISEAVSGQDRFIDGEGPNQDLSDFAALLSERGIDLSMSNDEIVAALQHDPDGQQYDQEKRGSIILPRGGLKEGETVISLFESANLSTFLHESGHFFLEAFTALATSPDAPQTLRDDLAVIHKFLGVEDGAALQTEQHETWARGFEAYLMEGKAPSLELASAFSRFKAWLSRIYRSVKGLNVNLTPEIREVMDRMLATDSEIAAMREDLGMRPLFTDAAPIGMSDADFATYQRMALRGAEQAEASLMNRTMEKVRRETQAWFKAEKKAVYDEVEASVNKMPVYRLTEMATNKNWLGETDQDVPDIQIDRDLLVEQFGDGVIAEIGRSRVGGKRAIYAKGGERPESVASMFGFESAGAMVQALQNSGKRKDFIAAEVDRIMVERHGDPLNDGSIEEAAALAVHSDQQAAMVTAEARAIARRLGRPTRDIKAKVYAQRARAMLGRMSVREASRPAAFLQAERRAAKTAEQAFARVARGGRDVEASLAAAMQAKEQQILNQYLYREARDFETKLQRGRERMQSYAKKTVREKLGGGYIEQIDALLERFDFRVRSKRQVERSESLRDYMDRMIDEGREAELSIDARLADESRKTHYTRLSVDELQGFFDTVANIDHMGRFKQKLVDAKDVRDLAETVSGVVGAMNANIKGRKPGRTETSADRSRKVGRDYLNLTLNADTLLREIDGFGDMGPAWSTFKERIDTGMARLTERRLQMAKEYDAIYSAYSAKEQRDMSVKRHHDGLGDLFSKWDIIAIALNTGNEDNYQRLTNPKTQGGFTPEQVDAALADLDARDWKTVQAIWDHINSFWPEIEAKERRTTGVAPPKVEAKVMSAAAPASVSGGYYPIKYDSRLSGRVGDLEMKDLANSLIGGRFGKSQTRNGHTKERVRSVSQPLLLDLSVAHAHTAQVLYDIELGEAVSSSWRVLQDARVKDAFLSKGKKSDHEALEIWLQDVASGDQVASRGLEKYMRHLRTGFVVSRLAMNVSTALIQPSGLVQSAVVVGKRAIAKGTIDFMKNPARWTSEVAAVSPLMRERQVTFERDIFNVVGDLEGGPVSGRWAKFQRDVVLPLSFLLMQKVQFYAVDMPTWVGAYQKELAIHGDEGKARLYADTMVKRAQGSGLMSDRGMLERGTLSMDSRQREFPRMLTALGSYMFAKGNVAYERTMKTNFKSPTEAMMWAVDMALLFTLEAVLYSAVKGYLPDEDEDETLWLLKETGFSIMSTLPGLREVSGAMQGFGGGGILGSIIEKAFAKPVEQIGQGEADKAAVRAVIDMAGIWLHLPSSQANAMINAIFDDDMGVRNDTNPMEMLGVGAGGNSPIEWLMQKN